MVETKRFRWGSAALALVLAAATIGLNLFYNEAHEARGLDRATFQVLFVALLVLTFTAVLAVLWGTAAAWDEVVRAASGVAAFWGWVVGTFAWLVTPWVWSLPDALVDPLSNPDGDTLFTLSEANGAYLAGGLVLILFVSVCTSVINIGWWLAKR